jgi:(4-O-methyl)-D-glucuronate---lignin esterase
VRTLSVRLRGGRTATILVTVICSSVSAFSGAPDNVSSSATTDPLLEGFRDPPNAARPQVWWHWMNGNVSLEGAKLDLAWMKRVGVGGVHTFAGGGLGEPHVVEPPVDFMSAQWQEIFRQATQIARASGLEVTIAGSPGWSETGGIWVAPENAMKKYVWRRRLKAGNFSRGCWLSRRRPRVRFSVSNPGGVAHHRRS